MGLSQHDPKAPTPANATKATETTTPTPAPKPTQPNKPVEPIEEGEELPKKSGSSFGRWIRKTFGNINSYGDKVLGSKDEVEF